VGPGRGRLPGARPAPAEPRRRDRADSESVRFVLTVDLDRIAGTPADELSRILRYWGGAAKKLDVSQPQKQAIYDSAYAEVGFWQISQ
jgi:hypothetical protein